MKFGFTLFFSTVKDPFFHTHSTRPAAVLIIARRRAQGSALAAALLSLGPGSKPQPKTERPKEVCPGQVLLKTHLWVRAGQ